MKTKQKKLSPKAFKPRWTNKCSDGRACGCGVFRRVYVPKRGYVCDGCLIAKYKLDTTYDSSDSECINQLCYLDTALSAIREAEKKTK